MSWRQKMRRSPIWLSLVAFFAAMAAVWVANGDATALLGFVAFPVVGAVILTSRPGNGVGRFLLGVSLVWTITAPLLADQLLAVLPAWLDTAASALGWPLWGLLPLVGLIFPTGRIETRMGRTLGWMLVGYVTIATIASILSPTTLAFTGRPNPVGIPGVGPFVDIVLGLPGIVVFVMLIVGIVIDLAVRWRRATGSARLQYRWLVFALTITVVVVAVGGTLNALTPNASWVPVTTAFAGVITNLIPISIGIAVTRHGLYEINRVVSRTVSYAIVTVLVTGVYALVVTSVTLLPTGSSIAVAAATLAGAALFLPVLRRVQHIVDRRFDRERYDAQFVVDAFGEGLRSQTNPSAVTAALIEAAEQTLRPASMGVWIEGDLP